MIKKDSLWSNVAVILVNYNGKNILKDCIESLVNNAGEDIEILVVDNGSKDDSMECIERDYSYVHTTYMKGNKGWGAGCNLGMRIAFDKGSKYVLLLNTDTEIEEGMIQELQKYCDNNTLAVPRIYSNKEDKTNSLWYSGGKIDFETADVEQTLFKYDPEMVSCNLPRKVDFASGCCMMLSKGIWQTVGNFDEEYFLYFEDADYCMQLKKYGIEILYVPTAALWHKIGGSSGGELSSVSQYYIVRNRLFFTNRYKEYMCNDAMGVLKIMLEQREYFATPYYKYYQNICGAGIKDFMQGIRGKEKNYIHDNYVVISGFYGLEDNGEGTIWQWSNDINSEIEVQNTYGVKGVLEVSGMMWVTEDEEERKVDIYWNNKYYSSVKAPLLFYIQGIAEVDEKIKIMFRTDDKVGGDPHLRKLLFSLADVKVKMLEKANYAAISGFYGLENNGEGTYWQWCNETESVVEIWNPLSKKGILEISGKMWVADDEVKRKVDVYWKNEYYGSVDAPSKFCIRGMAEADEKLKIIFRTNDKTHRNLSMRKLLFGLVNAKVNLVEET